MSEESVQAPADQPPSQDRMAEVIAALSGAMGSIEASPGEAVEAMAFLIGRIISMASQPGQIGANVESAKASIIASIAGHQRAALNEEKTPD